MIKGLFTEKEQMLYTSALLLVHPAGIEPTTFGVGVRKVKCDIFYNTIYRAFLFVLFPYIVRIFYIFRRSYHLLSR